MRILIVYCHPVEDSFAAALHRVVLQGLSSAGHELIDLDLYAENFAPVLSRQERIDYFDTARNFRPVKYYVDQLLSVDGIVLIYPTWWYGMPAMLKGYFDRVWLPGIAFDISQGGITAERLAHIRLIAVVTTYGSPWWLIRLYLGDPARKIVMRGLRRLCAPRCRALWYALYNMDRASPEVLRAVWNWREKCLLFSDVKASAIRSWDRDHGVRLFMQPSGYTGRGAVCRGLARLERPRRR